MYLEHITRPSTRLSWPPGPHIASQCLLLLRLACRSFGLTRTLTALRRLGDVGYYTRRLDLSLACTPALPGGNPIGLESRHRLGDSRMCCMIWRDRSKVQTACQTLQNPKCRTGSEHCSPPTLRLSEDFSSRPDRVRDVTGKYDADNNDILYTATYILTSGSERSNDMGHNDTFMEEVRHGATASRFALDHAKLLCTGYAVLFRKVVSCVLSDKKISETPWCLASSADCII